MAVKTFHWGLGRRKTSVARVRVMPGQGQIMVNHKPLESFFPTERRQKDVRRPLEVAEVADKYDVHVNVKGGGVTGQAGATVLGITRALIKFEPQVEVLLRKHGFTTRDPRMVERKKYGLRGARRGCQFSKR